jgi:hypothetical protein
MSDFSVVDSAETDHEEMVGIGRCRSSNWACHGRVRTEVERELNRTRQSKVGCRGSNWWAALTQSEARLSDQECSERLAETARWHE